MPSALILAQDPAPKTDKAAGPADASPFGNPLFMVALVGLFVVTMVWLPARRQKKEQDKLLAALKPGTKVVTSSGIVGSVVRVKDGEDEIIIRSEDAKLRVLRSTVTRVLGTDETADPK